MIRKYEEIGVQKKTPQRVGNAEIEVIDYRG